MANLIKHLFFACILWHARPHDSGLFALTRRTHPFVGTNGIGIEELETLRLASDVDSGRTRCEIYLLAIEALAPTSRDGDATVFLQLNRGLLDPINAEALVETIEDFLLVYIDRCTGSYIDITESALPLLCRALRIVKLKYRILMPANFGNPQFALLNGIIQKFEANVIKRELGGACQYSNVEPLLLNINQRNSAALFTLQTATADQLTALTCKASLLAIEALMPERGNPMDFTDENVGLVQIGRADLLNIIENIMTVYASPACERTRREVTPLAGTILCKALVNVSLKHKLIDLAINRDMLSDDEEFAQQRRQQLALYKDVEQQIPGRCAPNQTLF